jgi:hypothetical protein
MSPIVPQETPLAADNPVAAPLSPIFPPPETQFPPPPSTPIAPDPLAPFLALKIDDLRSPEREDRAWLWDGYLPRGGVTLLTSLWKAGKTTLIALLLDRLRTGGTLAGQTLTPGRAVVVSEESPRLWRLRTQRLGFGNHLTWLCRPFRGKPSHEEWLFLLNRLIALKEVEGLDLVVIDPLAAFLPGREENSAPLMLEALAPLQRLTALDISILLAHHPRRHPSPSGQASRGSGALPGFVDVIIEMDRFSASDDLDRRRRLRACSRYDRTPAHALIELNEAGTDYLFHGDFARADFAEVWQRLARVFDHASCKLTRAEIIEDWPDDDPRPADVSLRRWLDTAVTQGRLLREGAGHKSSPYLYWIPGKEIAWEEDPLGLLSPGPDIAQMIKDAERIGARRLHRVKLGARSGRP